jgi:hypothetical protein
MPTARAWAGACVIGNILYVVGGQLPDSGVSAAVEAYDPAADTWSSKTPMPTARGLLQVAVVNGVLYAVGGFGNGSALNALEAYDPSTDTWTQMPPMPTARWNPAVGVANGTLYVAGGTDGNANLATNEGFTPALLTANHPPIALCTDVTIAASPNCNADASVDNGSYDPDSGDTITLSQSPPGPYPLGTTAVTLTVTDNHGASSSCEATVTVIDTTPPVVTCPANFSIGCSVDLLTPAAFSVTAADNCDPNPTVTYSTQPGSGFRVGATAVTCTATDSSGNPSSCTFTVNRAPLGFTGFLTPVGGADATGGSFSSPLRTFKLNSTIPVKFTATCDGSPVLTGAHTLEVILYTTQTNADLPIDATPTDAATTGDQFMLSSGQWIFNLGTKATGMTAGIWLLQATLSDGSRHSAWIQLK